MFTNPQMVALPSQTMAVSHEQLLDSEMRNVILSLINMSQFTALCVLLLIFHCCAGQHSDHLCPTSTWQVTTPSRSTWPLWKELSSLASCALR